jgi:ABC-type glutathione transport system ATPase component
MNAPLLKLENVSIRHADRRLDAVRDVSLEVAAGSTLGIVGESGCGKSTLAKCLAGLLPARTGAIFWNGRDVTRQSPRQRLDSGVAIQIVFQDPQSSLNPRLSIRDVIVEPLRVAGLPTEGVAERLSERVGLPGDALNRRPHEFSGGQRQRVAIARALAGQPSLILLDEPTSALDLSVQAQILNLLLELQAERNLAYVFISHDLAVVHHIATDVAVMKEGLIVEQRDCESVFRDPTHAYTRELVAHLHAS